MVTVLARWGRLLAATAIGTVTAVGEALFLVSAGLAFAAVAALPSVRRQVSAIAARHATRIAGWERQRLAFAAGEPSPLPLRRGQARVFAYLAARVLPALLGTLALGLLIIGAWLAGIVAHSLIAGSISVPDALLQVVIGGALLLVNLQAIASIVGVDRRIAKTLLEASSRQALQQQIQELVTSRAEVVAAIDAERQRIERDLHDGLQQRLVALGMLIGRARRSRNADRAAEFLAQAHTDLQRAIEDMREVAWRLYPAALTHNTLDEVLAMATQRSAIPVKIEYSLSERPGKRIETALYFVASEAITNAVKHANATVITIAITPNDKGIDMLIRDDGVGGAKSDGTGLQGLTRRVTALNGRLEIHSPAGHGTTIKVAVPCE